jgi:hypothetical protein
MRKVPGCWKLWNQRFLDASSRSNSAAMNASMTGVGAIHNRRLQPLDQRSIAFFQQSQLLAQFPAVDIEFVRNGQLDDIALRRDLQIPGQRMNVNKAHIVIAVG